MLLIIKRIEILGNTKYSSYQAQIEIYQFTYKIDNGIINI
jgi:hypothetical protein